MSVRTVVSRLLRGDGTEVVVECRQCGTNLSPDVTECTQCESEEIAEYRISE